jgi:hypothetical protein
MSKARMPDVPFPAGLNLVPWAKPATQGMHEQGKSTDQNRPLDNKPPLTVHLLNSIEPQFTTPMHLHMHFVRSRRVLQGNGLQRVPFVLFLYCCGTHDRQPVLTVRGHIKYCREP